MKDAILFFAFVLCLHFLLSGEPNLYDLLHQRAIEAANAKGDA